MTEEVTLIHHHHHHILFTNQQLQTIVMSEQNCLFAAVRAVVGLSHCR